MRKVTFYIDDNQYFRSEFKKQNPSLTEEEITEILKNAKPFKAIYSIIGEGKLFDKYELSYYDGSKMNINDLDGYQRGIILNGCMDYFASCKHDDVGNLPCGVISIEESNI